MNMREFSHCMANTLINGASDFTAHRVSDADVHVGGRDGDRHHFKTVAYRDRIGRQVRLELLCGGIKGQSQHQHQGDMAREGFHGELDRLCRIINTGNKLIHLMNSSKIIIVLKQLSL